MSTRVCPYGGTRIAFEPTQEWACGDSGFLCDMCKADRADTRTDRLVEGLALAGLLANAYTAQLKADEIESGVPRTANYIARYLANIREVDDAD